jgi:predicted ATPase
LLDTFLASIHHPELSVLRARCVQIEGVAEPFMPLLEALERHCREPHGKELIEYMNQLAPSWRHQMLNVLDPVAPDMAQVNTDRMLREGAEFIEMLSKKASLILILDNAHWSDQSTLDFLNFLMFRCSATKLLIIVSYRSCDEGAGVQRIAKMQAELVGRGLGQELSIQKRGG